MHQAVSEIRDAIWATPWLDTHEHLVEERDRLGDGDFCFNDATSDTVACVPAGWTALIAQYAVDDLISAGMPERLFGAAAQMAPTAAWDALAPYLEAVRATGYLQAVDLTTEALFGLRLARDSCERIDDGLRRLRTPGYYRRVLGEVANVERCQVHNIDADHDPFRLSDQPDLLDQDISLYPMVTGRHDRLEELAGIEVRDFHDYLAVIDWCFDRYAPAAVAAKCLWAYYRPIGLGEPASVTTSAFSRVRGGNADLHEHRLVQDACFRHCVRQATERGLAVKLHTGYLAGNRNPQLAGVFDHMADLARLAIELPDTQFVLMHMGWPGQEAAIALAKHLPNVVIDLCWSWIASPLSTRDFVCRFLTTAPSTKLMCFGGDYIAVENVVGHAELARRGLALALEQLVADGLISLDAAAAMVAPLMRGNARRLFYGATPGAGPRTAAP
jgi:uncharacterized protein